MSLPQSNCEIFPQLIGQCFLVLWNFFKTQLYWYAVLSKLCTKPDMDGSNQTRRQRIMTNTVAQENTVMYTRKYIKNKRKVYCNCTIRWHTEGVFLLVFIFAFMKRMLLLTWFQPFVNWEFCRSKVWENRRFLS